MCRNILSDKRFSKSMKYIAVFLILNVLLLSSISGMANIRDGKASFCKQTTHQDCCKQSNHTSNNDCAKGTCNAMLSRSTCGFLMILPISLSPAITDLSDQITHDFITGELSEYQDNDWNPPKA
jgi:hypothetical protein